MLPVLITQLHLGFVTSLQKLNGWLLWKSPGHCLRQSLHYHGKLPLTILLLLAFVSQHKFLVHR